MTTSRTELRKVAGKGLALAGLLMMRGDAVLADANYCNPWGTTARLRTTATENGQCTLRASLGASRAQARLTARASASCGQPLRLL